MTRAQECLQGLQACQNQAERELIRLRVEIHVRLPRVADRRALEYWAPAGCTSDKLRAMGRLATLGILHAPI